MFIIGAQDAQGVIARVTSSMTIPIYVSPFLKIFSRAIWCGRTIKHFLVVHKDPHLYMAGALFLPNDNTLVTVVARTVAIARSLLSFSDVGMQLSNSILGLKKAVALDRKLLEVYYTGYKQYPFCTAYVAVCALKIVLIFQRICAVIVMTAVFAWSSFDLFDALTASKKEVIARSFAEWKEIVERVGDKRIVSAIEFHREWLQKCFSKAHIPFTVDEVEHMISGPQAKETFPVWQQALWGSWLMVKELLDIE